MNSNVLFIFYGSKNAINALDSSSEFDKELSAEKFLTCQALSLAKSIIAKAGIKESEYHLSLHTEVVEGDDDYEVACKFDNIIDEFLAKNELGVSETEGFTDFSREFTDADMKDYYGDADSIHKGDMERIAVIDNDEHTLTIVDISIEYLNEKFNGEEEEYLEEVLGFYGNYTWEYIVGAPKYVHFLNGECEVDVEGNWE